MFFWAVVALAWVGFGMALSGGEALGAAVLLVLALLFAGLALVLRRTQPVAYVVGADGVVIERRRGATRLPGVVEPHLERVTLGLRIGTGGVYGYRGRFRVSSGGWARAIVTDARRAVLIRVGGEPLVLSPVDPEALVRAVRDA